MEQTAFECAWCEAAFPMGADHTEIVRRDFVDHPRPSRVERLCPDCWATYVGEFLGVGFEAVLAGYGSE
jgi:hypothetical protein